MFDALIKRFPGKKNKFPEIFAASADRKRTSRFSAGLKRRDPRRTLVVDRLLVLFRRVGRSRLGKPYRYAHVANIALDAVGAPLLQRGGNIEFACRFQRLLKFAPCLRRRPVNRQFAIRIKLGIVDVEFPALRFDRAIKTLVFVRILQKHDASETLRDCGATGRGLQTARTSSTGARRS